MILLVLACIGLSSVPPPANTDDSGGAQQLGDLAVSASRLDFGEVELGSSLEKTVTITNSGDSAVGLLGLDLESDVFLVKATGALPEELAPGEELSITVVFEPLEAASAEGALELSTDAEGAELVSIDLVGTGVEPEIIPGAVDVDTTKIAFGTVDIGTVASETVTLSNTGAEDVLITKVESTEDVFWWGEEFKLPYVLSAGSSKVLTVTYEPWEEVSSSGTVTITTDSSSTPTLDIDVSGTGYQACTICSPVISVETGGDDPRAMSFGVCSYIGTSETKSIQVFNEGDQDLIIDSVTVKNDSLFPQGTFSVSGFSGKTTVAPMDSIFLDVTWKASANGADVGSKAFDSNVLHIISNDPYEGDYIIELSGLAICF